MLIWTGAGFLVPLCAFALSFATNYLTQFITGSDIYWDQHKWPLGVSLLVSAILFWHIGKQVDSLPAKILVDKETGKEVVLKDNHSFFFVKIRYWGPILAVAAIVIIITDKV